MQYHLNGFDIKGTPADFIDKEFEKMMNDISKKHSEKKDVLNGEKS